MDELEQQCISDEIDQYCQYEKLPVLLKRFSFKEKMRIAADYSSRTNIFINNLQKLAEKREPLPWFVEKFVMLAMEAKEYKDGDFEGKNVNKFIKMYNAIWDATEVENRKPCGKFNFADILLPRTLQNQLFMQENPRIRMYRYWQLFNDDSDPVNLKKVFKKEMGTEYDDYMIFGYILQWLFNAQDKDKSIKILQKVLLYDRFPEVTKHLRISRADYVTLQRQFINNSNDPYKYIYSLCPSYQYAFVEEERLLYCPLPHLISTCTTSSLLFRLTEGKNKLREQIGKHVLEKYLFRLVEDNRQIGVYQEAFPEQTYKTNGSTALSPDVLARQGNSVLFLDIKSTVPQLGIRLIDPASYEDNIRIVAENIVKLYKQIHCFNKYNPFTGSVSSNIDDFWGIVIVLEDAYIIRNHYYEAAKEKLKLQDNSAEWKWMISHIKVTSLYQIERFCLMGNSIIDACRELLNNNPFDFPFINSTSNRVGVTNENYLKFKKMLNERTNDIINDMRRKNILV